MATAVQGAAATGGAGSLALAASYAITSTTSGGATAEASDQEPQETDSSLISAASEPLEGLETYRQSEPSTSDSAYTNRLITAIASHNRTYLVKANSTKNQTWWKWAYTQKYLKNISKPKDPIFQNVVDFPKTETIKLTSAPVTTTTTSKTLNLACDQAYKAEKNKFDQPNDHLVENIGLFCTTGPFFVNLSEPTPKLYETSSFSSSDYTDGVLAKASNQPSLVMSKETGNQKWWEWSFEHIFDKTKKSTYESIFRNVVKGFDASPDSSKTGQQPALNQACDEGYKKTKAEIPNKTSKLLKEIGTFCTPGKKTVNLLAPGE